jgi:bifunctional DNase/RNase
VTPFVWRGRGAHRAERRDIRGSRPAHGTRDLLRNLINDLGARVDRVVVADLRETRFIATIHPIVQGEHVAVDARPSDAIALALRSRPPILVDEQVIEAVTSRSRGWTTIGSRSRFRALDPDELDKYRT